METEQAGDWVKVRCTVLKDGQPIRDLGSYGLLGRLVPPQFRLVAGVGAGEPALLAAIGQAIVGMRVGETKTLTLQGLSSGPFPWEELSVEVELLQIAPATRLVQMSQAESTT